MRRLMPFFFGFSTKLFSYTDYAFDVIAHRIKRSAIETQKNNKKKKSSWCFIKQGASSLTLKNTILAQQKQFFFNVCSKEQQHNDVSRADYVAVCAQ